ncbi:hypothetical protein ACFL27_12705 [candidate division CSSED10-310 bacterium]|uniref:KOW domain-containing protein n=1 Tax=candidate division CSSED10-310 bacterium TaxID=2855610 RepID=A0ABV6YXW6_UNCC1
MGEAYTPGLKVSERTYLRKERKLPLPGEVTVQQGERVKAEKVVARTDLPGNVRPVNVANILNALPEDVPTAMLKKEGDNVARDEVIAMTKSFFGLFKNFCKSPIDGFVESISSVTGQVLLREAPIPVEINAYVDGIVHEILPGEGVIMETFGTFIQGIFGIGGEAFGEILVLTKSPDEELTMDLIGEHCTGKVIVGGSYVSAEALNKAIEFKARGVVVGGFDDKDLRDFLGYDLGVAITGRENKGTSLILTEGFGKIRMADRTFELFKAREGHQASINGATQIRAGVIRPEVIIPLPELIDKGEKLESAEGGSLHPGSPIRCIREPYFGMIGSVVELPHVLTKMESETMVRVLRVKLSSGEEVEVPRANVETIEA